MKDLPDTLVVSIPELAGVIDRLWRHIQAETREGVDPSTIVTGMNACARALTDPHQGDAAMKVTRL